MIGKTRLVEEFVADLDLPVGWGAALAEAGMPPLWPLARALRRLDAPRAAVAALVAGAVDGDSGSADDAAARTFAADTAVLDAIEGEAEPAGLVLVLDDLQWADAATLRVLGRLAAAIRRLRVLVVATHRDADDPALAALLAYSGVEVRVLHPLSADAAEALLATMVEQLDQDAARQAVARSGGSPLYLRTVAQVAADQLRGRAAWQDPATAPELRQLVAAGAPRVRSGHRRRGRRRQRGRPAGAGLADGWAAPAGRPGRCADPAATRGAGGSGRDRAGRRDPLRARPGPRCRLRRPCRPSRRTTLHGRAAELLEPDAVGHDGQAGAVARHWVQAGRPDRAAPWALRAADAARAGGRLRRGRCVPVPGPRRQRPGRSRSIGPSCCWTWRVRAIWRGQLGESMALSRQAAAEGERSDRPDDRRPRRSRRAGHRQPGAEHRDRRPRPAGPRAAARPGRSPALRARVEAQLACALYELGEVAEADRWSARALADAEESGDPNAELDAIWARATLAWRPGSDHELLRARAACRRSRPTDGPAGGGAVRPRLARGLRRSAGRAVAGPRRAGRDATAGRADRPAPRPLALAPAYGDVRGAARRVGRLPGRDRRGRARRGGLARRLDPRNPAGPDGHDRRPAR